MLLDDFFTITKEQASTGSMEASIVINSEHPVLGGHFPGFPVVPGVCMMQIVKELAERHAKRKLFLSEADQMKFLSVLNPAENNKVDARLLIHEENGALSLNATLFSGSVVYFKMKAILTLIG